MSKKINRGNTLISHPFKDWYDQQILEGQSLNNIYTRQQEVVPPELIVSKRTISDYRKNVVKPNTAVVKEYKQQLKTEANEKAHQEMMQKPEVRQMITQKSGMMLDYDKTFIDLHGLLMKRLEKLDQIEAQSVRHDIDQGLAIGEMVDKVRLLTMDYLKARGKIQDAPQTQINIVNIEQKNAEMDALKNAVKETLSELDPSLVPIFFEKLQSRMTPVLQTFDKKVEVVTHQAGEMAEHEASRAVNTYQKEASKLKDKIDS